MKIPDQYLPVMPYIITEDASAFLEFTQKVLNAQIQLIVPGEGDRSIRHGEIRIADAVIMFAQKPDNYDSRSCGMFIYVENVDRIYQNALQYGSASLMPPVQQDYGYTAGFEDPFGNQWWIVSP